MKFANTKDQILKPRYNKTQVIIDIKIDTAKNK
jgi:hypothetical protein